MAEDQARTSLYGVGFKLRRCQAALVSGLHPSRTRACRTNGQHTPSEAKPVRVQSLHRVNQAIFCLRCGCRNGSGTLQKKLKVTALHDPHVVEVVGFKGKGRPRKDCKPTVVSYRIEAGIASVLETRHHKIQQKSCFIIASNQLEEAQLSHETMLDHYTPGQQKVERGFRFLKDPWFMANTLFLKSPKRIMALMMIMTLCLLIYGALEYRIRQTLQQHQQTFPTQLGTTTAKLTARWVFQFFAGIHVLFIDSCREVILNCNEYHNQLLKLLGERYVRLYANSG